MQRDMQMLTHSGAWPEAFEMPSDVYKMQENASPDTRLS